MSYIYIYIYTYIHITYVFIHTYYIYIYTLYTSICWVHFGQVMVLIFRWLITRRIWTNLQTSQPFVIYAKF